jgi:hypothetical protein
MNLFQLPAIRAFSTKYTKVGDDHSRRSHSWPECHGYTRQTNDKDPVHDATMTVDFENDYPWHLLPFQAQVPHSDRVSLNLAK